MRLIDADALIERWKGCMFEGDITLIIANAPTIPERKIGHWLLITDNNGQHFICDQCGEWRYHQEQKFCGECGADMRR